MRTGYPRVGDSVGGHGVEQKLLKCRGQAPMVFAKEKSGRLVALKS